ncbi:MAG: hypothetical protein WAZ14_02745 [Patescibacteria group bacterium]
MLTKIDLTLLKGMFKTYTEDVVSMVRDETRSLIAASEQRITAKLENKIDQLRSDVIDLTNNSILPQIHELQEDNLRIKKFVRMV